MFFWQKNQIVCCTYYVEVDMIRETSRLLQRKMRFMDQRNEDDYTLHCWQFTQRLFESSLFLLSATTTSSITFIIIIYFFFFQTIPSIMADVLLASMQKSGVKTLSIIDTISELATDKTEASRLTLPSPAVIRSTQFQPSKPGSVGKSSQQPGVPPRNPKVSVPFYSPNVSSTSIGSPNNVSGSSASAVGGGASTSGKNASATSSSSVLFNGAKPRFFATSSPKHPPNSSAASHSSPTTGKLNLSAISRQPPTSKSHLHTSNNVSVAGQHHNNSMPLQHQQQQNTHPFVQTHKSISNATSSRGQTPDWIRDIFSQAKRGNREKLVNAPNLLYYHVPPHELQSGGTKTFAFLCQNGGSHFERIIFGIVVTYRVAVC